MTYRELLNTPEWKGCREKILERDKNICQSCFNMRYLQPGEFRVGLVDYNKDELISKFLETVNGWCEYTVDILVSFSATEQIRIEVSQIDIATISSKRDENNLIYLTLDKKLNPSIYGIFSMNLVIKERFNSLKNIPHITLQENGGIVWHYARNIHVHHKYYQRSLKPWEYPEDALQTLCWSCHENLHRNVKIPILDAKLERVGELTPCPRCLGAGYFPEYRHVSGGSCFKCDGLRFIEFMR